MNTGGAWVNMKWGVCTQIYIGLIIHFAPGNLYLKANLSNDSESLHPRWDNANQNARSACPVESKSLPLPPLFLTEQKESITFIIPRRKMVMDKSNHSPHWDKKITCLSVWSHLFYYYSHFLSASPPILIQHLEKAQKPNSLLTFTKQKKSSFGKQNALHRDVTHLKAVTAVHSTHPDSLHLLYHTAGFTSQINLFKRMK